MDRITINPQRLRWACDDRGVSADELAEAVSAGTKTIAKAMRGEDGLTFGQLRSIAKFFNRGVLFFVEKGPVARRVIAHAAVSNVDQPEARPVAGTEGVD